MTSESMPPCCHYSVIRTWLSNPWIVVKDIILLSLAIPGLIALVFPSVSRAGASRPLAHDQTQGEATIEIAGLGSCNCGDTVAEAIDMGCQYDSLAAAWLPGKCRDDGLTAEFERMGNHQDGRWAYYKDENLTQEISIEELGSKADDPWFAFYTTGEWHMAHCLFYWRKQFRARFNNVTVEPRYDNERHLLHCITVLLNPRALYSKTASGVKLKSDEL
ncbi:hypothetical protein F4779DRAFT_632463 [Xylariaceae sp. FL0662B]|nr:hypothetical protein F4779DRAFT_632463 [Xylariaceae sp. FL0662B]